MPRSASSLVLFMVAAAQLVSLAHAQSRAAPPEELPGIAVPGENPTVVCPPKYPVPVFVPADALLQQADAIQPVQAGRIVTNRPVAGCEGPVLDAPTREYRDITYPRQLRELDTQIRLTQVELANWRDRVTVYQYFNKAGALMVDLQNSELAVLAIEERLRNLQYERMLVIRHHNRELALERQRP